MYKTIKFPNGETLIQVNDLNGDITVSFEYPYCAQSIITLAMLKEVLDREYKHNRKILWMPYVPFSRMDRIINKNESFSLKVFSNMINLLNFEEVWIQDPHSDVTTALINNVKIIGNLSFIGGVIRYLGIKDGFTLVSPDAGASKKTGFIAENISNVSGVIQCLKHRNIKTGKIEGIKIADCPKHVDNPIVVIDDICSRGGTFLGIADILHSDERTKGKKLYLVVTHFEGTASLDLYGKYAGVFFCNYIGDKDNFESVSLKAIQIGANGEHIK